jgi:hypothetical protein
MEMVPPKGHNNTVSTHCRPQQSDCGLRVSSTIPQEQLDDPPDCVPTTSTPVRQKRHRSLHRPSYSPIVKIRVLATRPEQRVDRRTCHPLEQLSEPLDSPSMEPNRPLFAEADHGAGSSSSIHHSLVAVRSLISYSSTPQPTNATSTRPDIHSLTKPNSNLANEARSMETCRLDIIRPRYGNTDLNSNDRTLLLQPHLEASSTNRSYQSGQDSF